MKAKPEDWASVEKYITMEVPRCILELRARVEALEQRATTEESSAPEPAADRPLWKVMQDAHLNEAGMVQYSNSSQPVLGEPDRFTRAAEIDAVAEWLDARAVGVDAVFALRSEARRAREGA